MSTADTVITPGAQPSDIVDQNDLAVLTAGYGVPFVYHVSCPSGGAAGTLDDVVVWSGNVPFNLRVVDATFYVSNPQLLTAAALRTASGGGGSVVLPDPGAPTTTFGTTVIGPRLVSSVGTANLAAGSSLFLRRDRSVTGELVLVCIRTP